MKYLLASILFLSAATGNAQLSFRILSVAGYGIGNLSYSGGSVIPAYSYHKDISYRSRGLFVGGILAGVSGGKAGFTTGLQFLSDGTAFNGYEWIYHGLGGGSSNSAGYFNGNTRFTHLVVPAIANLRFHIDSTLTFVPGVGIEGSFNLRGKIREGDIYDQRTTILSGHDFSDYYTPVTVSLALQANIEAALSRNSFVSIGLNYRYMISDFLRSPDESGHMYGFYGNIGFGFNWPLSVHTGPKKPVSPVNGDD